MRGDDLPGHLRPGQRRTEKGRHQGPEERARPTPAARADGLAQAPFPRTHDHDRRAARRSRGPGDTRSLGRRPDLQRGQQKRDRHARGTLDTVHDPPAPARRARRQTRPAGRHPENAIPAQAPEELADLGPGKRARPAQTHLDHVGHAGVFLRPAFTLAARHQREHQRAPAPILPQGHRPERIPRGPPRRGRRGTQRPAPQNTRLQETIRENTRTHQHSMIQSHQSKTAIKSGKTHRCCNHH